MLHKLITTGSLLREPAGDAGNIGFQVLGSLEVHAEAPVNLGGPRQRAVLARLVAAAGTVVSTDTLISDLYHGTPPANALASIHVQVSNLRRALEPDRAPRTPPQLLIARKPGYLLATDNVDALRFGELVTHAEQATSAESLPILDEALALWRGDPYGEFAGDLWTVAEVNRLDELRLTAVERRAQVLLDLCRPQAVIRALEVESGRHPLRERLWWLLALALYRCGRQADALNTLRRARDLISDQLGLDPGPELQSLEQDILQQADSLMAAPEPVQLISSQTFDQVPEVSGRARQGLLIGREQQLATLRALLAAPPVRRERDGVAVAAVSGEPGIGKTWLLDAFRAECVGLGCLVLSGCCHEGESVPPLWPWLQVLRALAEVVPPPDRRALAGLLDDEWPRSLPAAGLRHRNLLIAQWLAEAAQRRPLVIVLDDLHWADSATLELLRDITVLSGVQPDSGSLTLVTAYRDTVTTRGAFRLSVDEVMYQLARYDLVRIRLNGLDSGEVHTLAGKMGLAMDEATTERLAERTGGNPFFVCESARLLTHGQALDVVPDAVADLIRQRLAVLGPGSVEVLTTAAVIGRRFDPGLVAEVCRAADSKPAEVYGVLDRAAQTGLIVSDAGAMAFAHDLVRETLIGDVPPLHKAMIHREVMAALSAKPSTDVTTLAYHAVEAGPAAYREAAHWACAAAGQASLRLAYGEAAAWWGRAVAAHGACGGDPAEHVELLLHQVRALLDAGDAMAAREIRARAVQVTHRAAAGPELTARALTALDAPAIWTLRNPYEPVELSLVELFEATLNALPETDSTERTLLLAGLAQELYGSGDTRCLSLSAEAMAMARRIGDPHLLMRALNARALSVPQVDRLEELLKISEEIRELAWATGSPAFELLSHMMDSHYRLELNDLAGADEAAARCDPMLELLQLPWPRFQHTMWRANRLALAGLFDEADSLYREAEHQADRIGMWYAGAVAVGGRLLLLYQRGAMAEAGPLIDQIAGIHPTIDNDARVLQLVAQGRRGEAVALTARDWPTPPTDWSWLTMTCLQGAAQAAVGDLPACRITRDRLLPYGRRIAGGSAVACIGPVNHFLELLDSALHDPGAVARSLLS